jgi:predicted transcriptional regulator of viral defense system
MARYKGDLAGLVRQLIDAKQSAFSLRTFMRITGLAARPARQAIGELLALGLLTGVRRELAQDTYMLVPGKLGLAPERIGAPYLVVHLLTGGRDYFVSHGSAMEVHGMTPTAQPVLYISRPCYTHNRAVTGYQLCFLKCQPNHVFGVIEHWVNAHTRISISDLERTVLDGVRQSKYSGGFTAVVLGFQLRRADMDVERLVDYAVRLDIDNVTRRLGYLLDLCRVDAPRAMARLRARVDAESAYMPLDPTLPRRGVCCPRWRLHINLSLGAIERAAGLSRDDHLEMLR